MNKVFGNFSLPEDEAKILATLLASKRRRSVAFFEREMNRIVIMNVKNRSKTVIEVHMHDEPLYTYDYLLDRDRKIIGFQIWLQTHLPKGKYSLMTFLRLAPYSFVQKIKKAFPKYKHLRNITFVMG